MYMQFRNRSSAKVSMIVDRMIVDQIVKNAHLLVWVTCLSTTQGIIV